MQNDLTLAICAYNSAKFIEETLTCIINQTYQDFDLLIVNDCSSDNSKDLIEQFFFKNPRQYNLVNFEVNKGLSAGRHYAENNVLTEYILFVDSDDCPYPNLVEKLYNKITSDKDLIAVGCYHKFIDTHSKKIGGGIFLGEKTKEDFYLKAKNKKLIFMQPTAIININALLQVGGRNIHGFFEGKPRYQDLCEDLDLWTRMSDLYIEGKAIVVIPEVLCRYRKHEQALSSNSLGMIIRMKHIKSNLLLRRASKLEKTFVAFYNSLSADELKQLEKDARASYYLRNGVFLLNEKKLIKGIYYVSKSILMNPKQFYQKIKANSGYFN